MSRKTVIAAGVVVGGLLLAGGSLALWKVSTIRKAAAAPKMGEYPTAVEFTKASTLQWQATADLVGTVIPKRSVTVKNEVAGSVEKVQFESGAVVDEGQVLLTLESSTERADLASTEASISVSEANVKVNQSQVAWGEVNLARMQKAVDGKVSPQADLDRAVADLNQYKAELEKAQAEVMQSRARAEQVRVAIQKKTIKAPFRARAGLRNIYAGQYLAEGAEVVMLMSVEDSIYLDFAIPQEHLFRVKIGENVMATSSAFGPSPEPIRVAAMDAVANPSTRNVRVRGEVANPNERLRPGMSVDIRVPIGDVETQVAVPTVAVRRASFGDHVFVIGPGKQEGDTPQTLRAAQRFITLGPAIGSQTVVVSGLNAGDQLAGDGAFKLRDGAMVMPAPPPGSAPAAPGPQAPSAPSEPATPAADK